MGRSATTKKNWRIHILKLLIMPFSPTCSLAPNVSLSTMFSDAIHIYCSLMATAQVFISRSKGQVQKIASFTTSRNFQICRFRKKVGKSVPLQAWSGPEGSRKLSFPDFVTAAQDGGKVVSLTHRRPYPQEILLVLISVTCLVDLRAVVASGRILCR